MDLVVNFEDLPIEIIENIFRFLDHESKYYFGLVNKYIYYSIFIPIKFEIIENIRNVKYRCIICGNKSINDSLIYLCNCKQCYPVYHVDCIRFNNTNITMDTERHGYLYDNCPYCNRKNMVLYTNKQQINS